MRIYKKTKLKFVTFDIAFHHTLWYAWLRIDQLVIKLNFINDLLLRTVKSGKVYFRLSVLNEERGKLWQILQN